ncbi:Crp/Fnr family transcriptional regulator [Turicimonas muris]|uniref:Crp/Fnr family transcriptional regulator n=1 Tax=Turicimonas muris TaxID=1796652 RepID=UPI0023F00661|nr:Crp/Fnr family transcriptional regulator [Turicimonas muris]
MRQIVFGQQWIHSEEPPEIKEIFFKYGEKRKIKKGQELLHGGPFGEIGYLLKGLCFYRFWDWNDKEHVFSLILPKRCMGDIDGASCTVANVSAYVVKDGEALFLPYEIWHREISANTKILDIFTAHVVKKQESQIEALLACFTMEVDMRLISLFQALIKAYYPIKPDGWNPLPVQLNTVMLSKIISSSRTSVSLQLSEWANRGLVKKDGKFLLIHGALFSDVFDWWENRKTEGDNLGGRIVSSLNKQISNKK